MEFGFDDYGFNYDSAPQTNYDYSGVSDWSSNAYDYGAAPQQTPQTNDYSGVSDWGSNTYDYGATQQPSTQAPTPFWDYTFNAGTAGSGAQTPGLPASATPAYAATFGAGAGTQPSMAMGPTGSAQFATTAAPSQAGITGGMGVTPAAGYAAADAVGMEGMGFGTFGQPGLLERANAGLKQLGAWGKENAEVVKLGTGLASAIAGQRGASAAKRQQGVADQQIQRELAMREQAQQSQMAALAENQRMAGLSNQQAQQSFDEARSLYNPQEMAVRSMAQQTAATQRGVENLRKDLARRGLSKAAIDAEVRRARLGGSTAATTAYTKGLDTGRAAQQSALTSAKGLTSTVPGLSYTPSSSVADYYARQAEATQKQSTLTSAQLQKLLEDYLGQPTKTVQEARTKAAGATAV